MKYGWIDFGNKERKDVEKLLECFKEKGTVDELGIGGLRDAIANKLFPGTSTLHTRSKYYFIIPTIIKHVEKSDINSISDFYNRIKKEELKCCKALVNNTNTNSGIIGSSVLKNYNVKAVYESEINDWIKTVPTEIYWASLKKYNIFKIPKTLENISLYGYMSHYIGSKEKTKKELNMLNYRSSDGEVIDDNDFNNYNLTNYMWDFDFKELYGNITYESWRDNLNLSLTKNEANYLKNKILSMNSKDLLTYLLNNNDENINKLINDNVLSFEDLYKLNDIISEESIRNDLILAGNFSIFYEAISLYYNVIIHKEREYYMEKFETYIKTNDIINKIDFNILFINFSYELINPRLKIFLINCQKAIINRDYETLEKLIINREKQIKVGRIKKLDPKFRLDGNERQGLGTLTFRFEEGIRLIREINEGLSGKNG